MRIKRQRRKLRGKYSGNCLSCNAKWSKCWYIASAENQQEWQTRLQKDVTPCEDEVCFQCWDAKIRTSPKRKIHFKSELPPVEEIININAPRPSRRVERNKRRALNTDYTFELETTTTAVRKSTTVQQHEFIKLEESDLAYEYEPDLFLDEVSEESDNLEEGGILFEEDAAVFLLSTAFKTIPIQMLAASTSSDEDENSDLNVMNFNISLTGSGSIKCLPEIAKQIMNEEAFDEDMKAKKRGAYYCGKCGKLKKGHMCTSPAQTPSSSPSPSLTPFNSLSPSTLPITLPLPIPLPLSLTPSSSCGVGPVCPAGIISPVAVSVTAPMVEI